MSLAMPLKSRICHQRSSLSWAPSFPTSSRCLRPGPSPAGMLQLPVIASPWSTGLLLQSSRGGTSVGKVMEENNEIHVISRQIRDSLGGMELRCLDDENLMRKQTFLSTVGVLTRISYRRLRRHLHNIPVRSLNASRRSSQHSTLCMRNLFMIAHLQGPKTTILAA
jgi:hypothetical protein